MISETVLTNFLDGLWGEGGEGGVREEPSEVLAATVTYQITHYVTFPATRFACRYLTSSSTSSIMAKDSSINLMAPA